MTTTLEHIDGLRDVFTDVTQDCLMLDLTPCTVRVSSSAGGVLSVYVQFVGEDLAAADTLADSWDLARGEAIGADRRTYLREGRFDLNGRRVEAQVVTGCPARPLYPAGYAPQAVEA